MSMSANSLYHSPRSEGNKPGPGAKIINFEKEKRFTTVTNKACHCGFALSLSPNNFISFLLSDNFWSVVCHFGWAGWSGGGLLWLSGRLSLLTRCHQGVIICTNGSQRITLYHHYPNDPTFPATMRLIDSTLSRIVTWFIAGVSICAG